MRNLMVLGMLLVGASMAGWFTVNRQGDRTTIEIDREEIRDDARSALSRGRELLNRVESDGGVEGIVESAWGNEGQQGSFPDAQIAQQPQWPQQPQAWPQQPQQNWQQQPQQNWQQQPYQQPNYQPNNPGFQNQGQPLPANQPVGTQGGYYPPGAYGSQPR